MNFPARVTRDVAYYALEPFAKAGFARLVYSSFHGGPRHNCALEAAAADLTEKVRRPGREPVLDGPDPHPGRRRSSFEPVQDAPGRRIERDQLPLDRHAGYVETSIGLHLWPDLVEDGWQDLPPRTSESEDGGGSYLYDRGGAPTLDRPDHEERRHRQVDLPRAQALQRPHLLRLPGVFIGGRRRAPAGAPSGDRRWKRRASSSRREVR